MKLLILLLSLIFISCSNRANEKIYTKTSIITGTIEEGKFKEQFREENIEEGEVYFYINN